MVLPTLGVARALADGDPGVDEHELTAAVHLGEGEVEAGVRGVGRELAAAPGLDEVLVRIDREVGALDVAISRGVTAAGAGIARGLLARHRAVLGGVEPRLEDPGSGDGEARLELEGLGVGGHPARLSRKARGDQPTPRPPNIHPVSGNSWA